MNDVRQATAGYEGWLGRHTATLDARDLAYKHQRMADPEHAFSFLRATFYRWVQLWPAVCPELRDAPSVLAVGDLHVENFGTWRDAEGRLIWGVNDFDEVYPMPYPNDLVGRLAVSMKLAVKASPLDSSLRDACAAILVGYRNGMQTGGRPFVLEEKHPTLRTLALGHPRAPDRFWKKFRRLVKKPETTAPPPEARAALLEMLPQPGMPCAVRPRRRVGLGSLGKPRFLALASWDGGLIAREVKALTPSACAWAAGAADEPQLLCQRALNSAVRCPDPYFQLRGSWIVRRLAPECSRITLESLATVRDESRLRAMGAETANVHLGTGGASTEVLADLAKRPADWLWTAARAMVRATRKDWRACAKSESESGKPPLEHGRR